MLHLNEKGCLRLGGIKGGLRCWVAPGLLPLAKVRLRSTGSCTPPHNWPKNDANDAFSIRFDNNLGWVSVFVFILSAAETLQQMNALKGELRVPLAKGHLRATGSCTPPHSPYRHQVKSGGQFRCKRSLELDTIMYPPHSPPKSDASDAFSTRFDDGWSWLRFPIALLEGFSDVLSITNHFKATIRIKSAPGFGQNRSFKKTWPTF